jgi:hypothetical protein
MMKKALLRQCFFARYTEYISGISGITTSMFTRYFSSNRKILILSIITGLIAALLLGSLQFFWSYHKREVKFDTLMNDVSIYMESYFDELKTDRCPPAAHAEHVPGRQPGTHLARGLQH